MKRLISLFVKLLPSEPIYAHCDIPCGIYDPHQMQLAAHTVIRMTHLLKEAKDDMHKIARITHVKEEHGHSVEEEVETLWMDYFKDEHFKEHPELKDLLYETIKLSGTVRQNIDPEGADKLLANTQEIAEIFWKTKGMEPIRIPSGYPTEGEIVSHK